MKSKVVTIPTILTMALSLFLTACGGGTPSAGVKNTPDTPKPQSSTENKSNESSQAKVKTIKLAHYFATDHPQNVALREKFVPLVEQKSGGTLKVEIYDNSKLGKEAEIQGVRNGTIEMGVAGMTLSRDLPILGVPEWPFLFENFAHANKVLNGPIGQEITKDVTQKFGIRHLGFSANGFRVVSSKKPIKSMADFKGFRLRMPNVPTYIELGKLWGASVQPLDISEIFNALESGVIDGQENPYATLKASKWYEVQSHVLQTYHLFAPNMVVINEKFWQGLTPEQQKAVEEGTKAYIEYEWKLLENQEEELKKFLTDAGLKITVPDETLKKELRDSAQPMYDKFYTQYDWAKDLVERIRKEAK